MAYNLRNRNPMDYAAIHSGLAFDKGDELEEFHDSFQYQPAPDANCPQIQQNPAHASSMPFSSALPVEQPPPQDDLAELTTLIASTRAENEALERHTEVARLKAKLHALRQRNAQLQAQTANLATGKVSHQDPPLNMKNLRSNPVLTNWVSKELGRLGLSASDSEDKQDGDGSKLCTSGGAKGKRQKSGKTTKLTSRVVCPQLWPHSQLSLAYVSKQKRV